MAIIGRDAKVREPLGLYPLVWDAYEPLETLGGEGGEEEGCRRWLDI